MIRKTLIAVGIVLLLAGAFLLIQARRAQRSAVEPPSLPPRRVRTVEVRNGTLPLWTHRTGELRAEQVTLLAPRIHGTIQGIVGEPGDSFRAGELLVRLDARELRKKIAARRAEIERLRSRLELRRRTYERQKRLFREDNTSKQELDRTASSFRQAKAELRAARRNLEAIRAKLGYALIRAPYNGTVRERLQEPGDMAVPGRPVLELANPARGFKVLARVPPDEASRLQPGAKAVLSGRGPESKRAEVGRIYPAADDATDLARVEIPLQERPFGLPCGSLLGVDILLDRRSGLLVPGRCILRQEGRDLVFALSGEDRIRPVRVSVLARSAGKAVVRGDLKPGDRLVLGGESRLLRLDAGERVQTGKAQNP
jgi:RND family efflux transporter MFP subunit